MVNLAFRQIVPWHCHWWSEDSLYIIIVSAHIYIILYILYTHFRRYSECRWEEQQFLHRRAAPLADLRLTGFSSRLLDRLLQSMTGGRVQAGEQVEASGLVITCYSYNMFIYICICMHKLYIINSLTHHTNYDWLILWLAVTTSPLIKFNATKIHKPTDWSTRLTGHLQSSLVLLADRECVLSLLNQFC